MILIITIVLIAWIINRQMNRDIQRIREIENRLDQYYKEREERIIKGIKKGIRNKNTHNAKDKE